MGDPNDEYIENFLKQIDLNEEDGISFNKFKEIMKDSLNEKKEKKLIKEWIKYSRFDVLLREIYLFFLIFIRDNNNFMKKNLTKFS